MRIWHLFSALLPLSPARLSSTATLSPRAAQSRATARPMPSAPPVTTIVRAVFDCGVIRRAPQGLFPGLRITRWSKSCSCPDGRSSAQLYSPPMHL